MSSPRTDEEAEFLRAAVLLANAPGERATWVAKQGGGGYSTFRAFLADGSHVDLRAAAPVSALSPTSLVRHAMSASPESGLTRSEARTEIPVLSTGVHNDWIPVSFPAPLRLEPPMPRPDPSAATSQLSSPPLRIRVARWSKQGPKTLVLGREDGIVDFFSFTPPANDTVTGSLAASPPAPPSLVAISSVAGHFPLATLDADFSLRGGSCVTAGADGSLIVWLRKDGVERASTVSGAECRGASWYVARRVACGGSGSAPTTSTSATILAAFPSPIHGARFHPVNDNLVFVARAAKSVWILNASTGLLEASFKDKKRLRAEVTALCTDESGAKIFAGDADGKLFALSHERTDVRVFETRSDTAPDSVVTSANGVTRTRGGLREFARTASLRLSRLPLARPRLTRISRTQLSLLAVAPAPNFLRCGGGGSEDASRRDVTLVPNGVVSATRLPRLAAAAGEPAVVVAHRSGLVRVFALQTTPKNARDRNGSGDRSTSPFGGASIGRWTFVPRFVLALQFAPPPDDLSQFSGDDARRLVALAPATSCHPTATPAMIASTRSGASVSLYDSPSAALAPGPASEAALAEGVRFRHEFPTPEGFANATTAAFDGDGALLVVAYAREGENGGEGEARAWARVERNTSINRRPS